MPTKGDFDFTAEELDALFGTESQETPPADSNNATEQQTPPTGEQANTTTTTSVEDTVETTKAFARRLSERTSKAVAEEREAIAHKLGYKSYEEMMQTTENRRLEDNGLDPAIAAPVINQLVEERLKNLPQMQELAELRALKVQEYGKQQLAEITKLTDGKITKLDQLPKEVIDIWKQTGDLKKAYLQVEGENLIMAARRAQSQGSVTHMATPQSGVSSIPTDRRLLTEEEKRVWKLFNPQMTDEELNKQTTKK